MADNDNRIARRQRVLKTAKLVSKDYNTVIDCAVKDLSETGAKLKVGSQASVTNDMLFVLPIDNTMRDFKVVWRKDDLVGIHFTSDIRKAPMRKW
jgi:PilZ domain